MCGWRAGERGKITSSYSLRSTCLPQVVALPIHSVHGHDMGCASHRKGTDFTLSHGVSPSLLAIGRSGRDCLTPLAIDMVRGESALAARPVRCSSQLSRTFDARRPLCVALGHVGSNASGRREVAPPLLRLRAHHPMSAEASHDSSPPAWEDTPSVPPVLAAISGPAHQADALVNVPLVRRVVADFLSKKSATILRDSVTCEAHELQGLWALEFGEGGDGCVAEEASDRVRFLDEVFCAHVSGDAGGQVFVKLDNEQMVKLIVGARHYEERSAPHRGMWWPVVGLAIDLLFVGQEEEEVRLPDMVVPDIALPFYRGDQLQGVSQQVGLRGVEAMARRLVSDRRAGPLDASHGGGGGGLHESLMSADRFLATSSISSPGLVWALVRLSGMVEQLWRLAGQGRPPSSLRVVEADLAGVIGLSEQLLADRVPQWLVLLVASPGGLGRY